MRELKRLVKGKLNFNERISPHTTFRIGGLAEAWAEPEDADDLRGILKASRRLRKPIYVAGGGSNLLVNNKRLKGIVIRLSAPYFRRIIARGERLRAGAGASLKNLLALCAEKGLTGLEFCSGIPGTVGGAVLMNTGSTPKGEASNIADFLKRVRVMDKAGRIRVLYRKDLTFGYRTSSLGDFIILEAEFALRKARKGYVKQLLRKAVDEKRRTQDFSKPSAGCIFKNPCSGLISAGRLIELAGLKGEKNGRAQVSRKHANYIVNLGNASFRDVKGLIETVRKRVRDEFNVELETEIKVWE